MGVAELERHHTSTVRCSIMHDEVLTELASLLSDGQELHIKYVEKKEQYELRFCDASGQTAARPLNDTVLSEDVLALLEFDAEEEGSQVGA